MRIIARTTIACAGWSAFPGQVVDVPRAEAQPIVDAGYAEEVMTATSTVRTAEAPAPARQAVAPEPEEPEDKPRRRRKR